jgi:hypothetical protein
MNEEDSGKVWRVSIGLPDHLSAPLLGILSMVGLKEFTLEVVADEANQAQRLGFDLRVARSSFQMAKMMLGDKLPPGLISFLEVFKKLSLDVEFDSVQSLLKADSPLKNLLPPAAIEQVKPNATLDSTAADMVKEFLSKANESNPQGWTLIAPVYGLLVEQFKELKGITVVAGDHVIELKLPVNFALFPKLAELPTPAPPAGVVSDDVAASLPKTVDIPNHNHTLTLLPKVYFNGGYGCDICHSTGTGWVYHCDECSWDAHVACAQANK